MKELRVTLRLLAQAETTETHKHWGQETYIAHSEELELQLEREYGRSGLCLKVFKHCKPEKGGPFMWGGSKLTDCTKVQNLFALDCIAPRVYDIIIVNGVFVCQVVDYACTEGEPYPDQAKHLIKKYKLGLKGKKGDPIKEAIRYARLPFKWIGHEFVDFGRFYFADPEGYETGLRKRIQHRKRGPGGSIVGYQEVRELGIPGQRNFKHRMKQMRFDAYDFAGKTVLDLGCNNGTMLREVSRRGAKRVIGVDYKRTRLWAELNNWLGYWNIDFVTAALPAEWRAIQAVTGVEQFDVVLALAIVQHMEGGYGPWIAELTKEVLYLEGNWHTKREDYWDDLKRDFRRIELAGWIRDEDRRPLFKAWKTERPAPKLLLLGEGRREEAIQRGRQAEGIVMLNSDELGFLYDMASAAPNGATCEVGVMCGSSVLTWSAARWVDESIYAVDNENRPEFQANREHHNLAINFLLGNSWAMAKKIDEPLAFCFIDADHTEAGIPKDIAAYTPLMMEGGIICFDDYGRDKAGVVVQKYVDEWNAEAQWPEVGRVPIPGKRGGWIVAYQRPYGDRNETT